MPRDHHANGLIQAFGFAPDGAPVERIWIANNLGMRAGVLTWGASLQTLTAPDTVGVFDDVVLGHDDLAPYVETPSYIGAIVGRFANRIANGAFTLDGRRYDLSKSDGAHSLHGGARGFDKALWRLSHADRSSVTLTLDSPDGDQGYPGALHSRVTYRLSENAPDLSIAIEAQTSAPTIVSLTSHAFFNLAGARSGRDILDHFLTIAADAYTPVDATLIPTGEYRAVAGGPFDFREGHRIGARIHETDEQLSIARGYDHNFALRGDATAEPKWAARLSHPATGRSMDIFAAAPGLQFYSGNFLDGRLVGKGGVLYRRHFGLCLEPQMFPDAPNKPAFPSARLDPGQIYRQTLLYKFSARAGGVSPF